MTLDIYESEQIKKIAKKWHRERFELTHDDLHKMLNKIWKLVK